MKLTPLLCEKDASGRILMPLLPLQASILGETFESPVVDEFEVTYADMQDMPARTRVS